MTMLSVLATVLGAAMGISNFLQAYKIFRRKSAKDISIAGFSLLFVGAFIWVLYGIEINSLPIILSNLTGTLGVLSVIIGWFMYGRKS
jgi:MtN3 and saliva related transmembrane protein